MRSLFKRLNSDPIDPDSVNPNSSLEIPPSEFHDCSIVSDTETKLDEMTLLKGDINVPGPPPAVEPIPVEPFADSSIKPLMEGITQTSSACCFCFSTEAIWVWLLCFPIGDDGIHNTCDRTRCFGG